jgi:hypothetical protein
MPSACRQLGPQSNTGQTLTPGSTGWIDLEFGEPWSQPGFLTMTVIVAPDGLSDQETRVVKTLHGFLKDRLHNIPAFAMGGQRRYLIQPVSK